MKSKEKVSKKRDIQVAINNAIALALRYTPGGIPDRRLQKLRAVTISMVNEIVKLIEDEFIRPEEAVIIFLAGAELFQVMHVQGKDHVRKIEE